MKKQIVFIAILVLGIILVGCNTTQGAGSEINQEVALTNDSAFSPISEYIPFLENTILEYEGIGNEFAEQSVFYEFIDGNKAQMKVRNPGTNLIKILELKDGSLTEIYREGEFYHIENMLHTKGNMQEIILMEPLELGNTWITATGLEKEITGIDVSVDTPYKSFNALEVTTSFDEGRYQKEYFAKGIGLVSRIYVDGEYEVKTMLKDIKKAGLEQSIELFYPLEDNDSSAYIQDTLVFNTNGSVEKLIEDKLKNPVNDQLSNVLPNNVSINSINIDRTEWILKVDLSDNFLSELNAGSAYEYEVLRSLINTLGKFFDTEEVYISIAGRPYESGHLQLVEGEVFKVDLEGIKEHK